METSAGSKIWHNGEIKDDAPILSAHDRLRLGEGVFNTMLAIDGQVQHGNLHMNKILHNARLFASVDIPHGAEKLIRAAQNLLQANGHTSGRYAVNTLITLGNAGGGIAPPEKPDMQVIMRSLPLPVELPAIHAITALSTRRNEHSPLSRIKGSFYGDNILAAREAKDKGGNEPVMLNTAGHVACFGIGNIAAIIGDKLVTPPLSDGCQDGITRRLLLQQYEVAERNIRIGELATAQGIYLLNSLRGAFPVSSLDGMTLPAPAIAIPQDFHLES